MTAWQKDQSCDGSLISFLGDPAAEFTKALGMVLDHPGPMGVLGYPRTKRFSMLVNDGVVKTVHLAEAENDPAGDDKPDVSLVEGIIADLDAKKDEL